MVSVFEYKGSKISYSDEGKGNALVFIHGFLEEKSMWKLLTNGFKVKYRCICIDLFGHGDSENHGYIHTMKEQAEMIKAVLNKLRLRRYTLIGHSMGGYIALELLKNHSKNVRGLVLQNSTSYADTAEKIVNRNRAIIAVKENPGLFIKVAIPMLFSEKNRSVFRKEIDHVTTKAMKTSTQGIVAALEGMKIRANNSELLKKHKIPILMIIGKEDTALSYNSLIEQTKNSKVKVEVFNDGHMSHIENYDALKTCFADFFKTCN